MSHKKSKNFNPAITERIGVPLIQKDTAEKPLIMCPWCKPSHPLSTVGASACGTILQVRAVQVVYHTRYKKDLICVKCQQGGGDMTMFNNAFIHTHDCMPGVATFVDPPKFSGMAALVFKLPKQIKSIFEKYLGEAKAVEEVTDDGTRTGRTMGYFFWRKAT